MQELSPPTQGSGNSGNSIARKKILIAALKVCSRSKDLENGKRLHAEAVQERYLSDTYVINSLINMYAKCGSMIDARKLFDEMDSPTVVSWNSLLLGYVDNGDEDLCLELIQRMVSQSRRLDALTYVAAIKACTKIAVREKGAENNEGKIVKLVALEKGRKFHARAARSGFAADDYVSSSLINMYARCGSMDDARRVFDERGGARSNTNIVSWNSLLLGYAENGDPNSALELFDAMPRHLSDPLSFVATLKACTCLAVREHEMLVGGRLVKAEALKRGRILHKQASASGYELENFVANTLIDMYAKSRSMIDARRVFDRMLDRSAVSWNALLLGYIDNGEEEVALEMFASIPRACRPNSLTYVAALRACSSLASRRENCALVLKKGRLLHSEAENAGFGDDDFVANTLVDMYAKCGSLADAKAVFDKMPCRDAVSWNALIHGCAENGKEELALELFHSMRRECPPSALSFVAALKACTNLSLKGEDDSDERRVSKAEALEKGRAIHAEAVKSGFDSHAYVGSSLVNMYCKCGSLELARKAFISTKEMSAASWNTLLLGLVENGDAYEALKVFSRILHEGFVPNALTFAAVLKACVSCTAEKQELDQLSRTRLLAKGRSIHHQITETGYDSDACIANTLVDFYAKCQCLDEARKVFDGIERRSLVSWTSLMLGFVAAGKGNEALELFSTMQSEGCQVDAVTIVAALKACTLKENDNASTEIRMKLSIGKSLHIQAAQHDHDSKDKFVASALINMYSTFGSMTDAQRVFDKVPATGRDLVVWNSLLLGYAENGDLESTLALFTSMKELRVAPNAQTFAAAIKACSRLAITQEVHACICRSGLEDNIVLAAGLVDAYGKAGSLICLQLVFESLSASSCDLVTWNSLIAGLSRLGEAESVEHAFHMMIDEDGVKVDSITFVSLLNAFNHAGLVSKCKRYFETMISKYGVSPSIEHYHCMIDILGRANELEAAISLVETMPYKPNSVTWMSVLSACDKWRNLKMGKIVFDKLAEMRGVDQRDLSSACVLMARIYDSAKNLNKSDNRVFFS